MPLTESATAIPPFHVEVRGLSKVYGESTVLSDVSFDLHGGKVVGLIGANGAGKSTLIKCLTGVVASASGSVFVDGVEVALDSPAAGLHQGFSAVSQKVILAEQQSVAENVMLGLIPSRFGVVAKQPLKVKVQQLLDKVGLKTSPDLPVGALTPSDKRLVMIAAVLARNPRVIIFDEPTAALPAEASSVVVNLVKELRTQGHAIIYITHRLHEVQELADSVIALSNGKVAGILDMASATHGKMLSLIGGEEVAALEAASLSTHEVYQKGAALLEVRNLSGARVHDVSFTAHAGEIIGIGGLAGAGRSELVRLIFGLQPASGGECYVNGKALGKSIRSRVNNRIGYIAEFRDANILKGLSVTQNATISGVGANKKFGLIADSAWEKRSAKEVGDRVSLVGRLTAAIETLSGGNQQKVLLGRLIIQNSDVLLLDEPTAGVDLVARAEIHEVMRDLAQLGKSIIVSSVETDELTAICDRVLILVEGGLAKEIRAPFTQEELVNAFFHHSSVSNTLM